MTNRDRAAVVLATSLGLSLVGVVIGVYVPAVRFSGPGLSDAGLELLLGVIGGLIGAVGVTLSHSGVTEARARVALIMAATIAAVSLTVVGFIIYDAVWSSAPAISPNTGKILATLLGGMIGALLGYLGLGDTSAASSTAGDDAADPTLREKRG